MASFPSNSGSTRHGQRCAISCCPRPGRWWREGKGQLRRGRLKQPQESCNWELSQQLWGNPKTKNEFFTCGDAATQNPMCHVPNVLWSTSTNHEDLSSTNHCGKNGGLKTHGWSSSHPNWKPSSSWHDCHRILRKARRAPLRKSQTRGKGTSRLPALPSSEKLSDFLEQQIRKETQQSFATEWSRNIFRPSTPILTEKTPQNVKQQKTVLTTQLAQHLGQRHVHRGGTNGDHHSYPDHPVWRNSDNISVTTRPKCPWKSHKHRASHVTNSTRGRIEIQRFLGGANAVSPKKLFKLPWSSRPTLKVEWYGSKSPYKEPLSTSIPWVVEQTIPFTWLTWWSRERCSIPSKSTGHSHTNRNESPKNLLGAHIIAI